MGDRGGIERDSGLWLASQYIVTVPRGGNIVWKVIVTNKEGSMFHIYCNLMLDGRR